MSNHEKLRAKNLAAKIKMRELKESLREGECARYQSNGTLVEVSKRQGLLSIIWIRVAPKHSLNSIA